MKKILTAILIATFFLGVGAVNAQKEEKKERSETKNVKIHKKQPISDEERNALEELESKGKPSTTTTTTTKFVLPATGNDVTLPLGGKKYAILIGMANYPGTTNDLCVADAETALSVPTVGLSTHCKDEDALHMYDTLINEYAFDEENIIHLSDAQVTYDAVIGAIEDIKSKAISENDEVIFFFSGHGFTGEFNGVDDADKDGDNVDEAIGIYDSNYPEDSEVLANLDFWEDYDHTDDTVVDFSLTKSLIFDDELKELFKDAATNRITFIFDTCGAGGMNDLAGDGRMLVMSSLEGQTSYTFYLGGTYTSDTIIQDSQGLFTHYFVNNAMEDGLADGYNLLSKKDPNKYDGEVSIEEAFGYAYLKVSSVKPQTPVLNDYDKLLDFLP